MLSASVAQKTGQSPELIRAEDITKVFGAVKALKAGSLILRAGEVHALVGVNGAGKSTLSRIVSGHLRPTSGTLLFKGQPVDFRSPRDAMRAGISLVMQETCIADDMTVLENICLTSFAKPGRLDWQHMTRLATEVLETLGQGDRLPLHRRAGDLSMAQRQLIEICRALQEDAEVIIFDEPTASLSPDEVKNLFAVMRMLTARGKALVFVSHRLEEIFEITDRVTVMRDGKTVESDLCTADLDSRRLIRLMIGRDLEDIYDQSGGSQRSLTSKVLMEVKGLAVEKAVKDVSFSLHEGEILGLAGLVGAGRSETLEALFGLRKRSAGTLMLNGQPFSPSSARDAMRSGMGFIGEDRRRQGVIPDFSVTENLLLAHMGRCPAFLTNDAQHKAGIARLLGELDMPEHILRAPMLGLSGGQQQKVLFARWLLLKPTVLLLDEPTRGVDIGTRNTLYQLVRKIAEKGVGVVVVSSDFEELLGICDRIVVLSDGQSVAQAPADLFDRETLAMFAAPRSSAQGIHQVLSEMSQRYEASASWLQVEHGRVFCFDQANPLQIDTGIGPGSFPLLAQTQIPLALDAVSGVPCTDGELETVTHLLGNQNGHRFGVICLTRARALSDSGTEPLTQSATCLADALLANGLSHFQIIQASEVVS
jgi:ribose transport system ATP-binding protein/rhamnose transport system ATP-binding protein